MFLQGVEDHMKHKSCDAIPGIIASLFILAAVAGGARAEADSADVQQQLFDALARGDVTAAVALFTDDAVIDDVPVG
jgi:hypothetical protein